MNSKLRTCSITSFVRNNPYVERFIESKVYEQRHKPDDIKFVIGSEEIPAHRSILAALSLKYKKLCYVTKYTEDVFNINDVSHSAAFKEFLQFFYMDKVTLTLENIEDVLILAEDSLVKNLVDECANFLMNMIGLDKLLWCYRLTFRFHVKMLKEFCSKEIEENVGAVFQMTDFLDCEKEMLRNILALDLVNRNETEVFDACISWARAKCGNIKLDGEQSVNLRAVLGEALYKIHFYSMTIEEFTTVGEKYPGLLTSKESNDVLRAFVQNKLNSNEETSTLFGESNGYVIQRHSVHKIIVELSTLECSLSIGIRTAFDPIQDNNDCIGFSCDNGIYLNGIVLFNEFFNDIEILISTLYWSKKPRSLKVISNNETKITFDHPIRVDGNEWCYINVIPKNCSSIHLDGFHLANNAQQNGVSFQFISQNFQELNLITRLLFNTL